MNKKDKKWLAVMILYILMIFFTHSYMSIYRYHDWVDPQRPRSDSSNLKLILGSLAWPVYWTSRFTTYLVEEVPKLSIKVKINE